MAQANMYRVTVGDFVYFEQSPSAPYLIRKIDELTMTPNKNVEARCLCFYRRRDLPPNLLVMADRYQPFYDVDQDQEENQEQAQPTQQNGSNGMGSPMKGTNGNNGSAKKSGADDHNQLQPRQLHQVKHRELYISRTVETLPATGIRGKCTVTLLNEEESLQSYLNTEDAFFYSLKYDPQQKTLITDRGDIKVGSKYQVDSIPVVNKTEALARPSDVFETLVWKPEMSQLSDEQISQFIIVAKAVGLYARAIDVNSSVRSPSLHSAAILSSRDSILQFAADVLHRAKYNVADALKEIVPAGTGPVLVRDQLEEWSPAEAALFEEGMEKYGKDFENIRADLLPWKSMRSMVEFYYIWKTTDRYQNRRKAKASENENKMKQVYIPAHTKPNPALIAQKPGQVDPKAVCESCGCTDSAQWYAWSPQQASANPNQPQSLVQPTPLNAQHKLCGACWTYWKKCGGLKQDLTRLDGAAGRPDPGTRAERVQQMQQKIVKNQVQCQMPECLKVFRNRPLMLRHLYNTHEVYVDEAGALFPLIKTPSAFVMTTTLATMLMRRLLASGPVHLARVQRNPTAPIDFAKVYKEYGLISEQSKGLEAKRLRLRKRKPHFLATGLRRLNVDMTQTTPEWLQRTPPGEVKQPARLAFPKPDKMPYPQDQQPLNDRKAQQPSIMRKRTMDAASISPVPNATPRGASATGTPSTKQEPTNLSASSVKTETSAAPTNLTTGGGNQADRTHHNGVGPTPAKQQHLSSPPHGSSSRNSNSRPPVHYPQSTGTAASNGNGTHPTGPQRINPANRASANGLSGGGAGAKGEGGDEVTPDDMFFVATPPIVTARKVLSASALRKASRRPFSAIRPSSVSEPDAPVKAEPAPIVANGTALDGNSNHSNGSHQNGNNNNNGTASVDMSVGTASKLNAGAAADGRTAMAVD